LPTAFGGHPYPNMPFDPQKHHRHSIRLKDYDYTKSGVYFVTLCAWRRECIFGEVVGDELKRTALGDCVYEEWEKSASLRTEIEFDVWVVMPNHLHGLVVIQQPETARGGVNGQVGAHGRAPLHRAPRSLGSFIAGFKSAATTRINELRQTPGLPVWQRNYHEHIIRTDQELNTIRRYIQNNPLQWALDADNPQNKRSDKATDYWIEAAKER
jgi:putative transposase